MNTTVMSAEIATANPELELIAPAPGEELTENIIEENDVKISLIPSKRKTVKKINVIIEGVFTIKNVHLVKENCQRLLQYYDMVSITLKNIIDIDLAAIQLIRVLNTSELFMQKTITIESELSKDDRALLLSTGMMEVMAKRK